MSNSFGDAFKQAIEKSGKKDLSGYKIDDLFKPTTQDLSHIQIPRIPVTEGDACVMPMLSPEDMQSFSDKETTDMGMKLMGIKDKFKGDK